MVLGLGAGQSTAREELLTVTTLLDTYSLQLLNTRYSCPYDPQGNETACVWTGSCEVPGCSKKCVVQPALVLHAYDGLLDMVVPVTFNAWQCFLSSSFLNGVYLGWQRAIDDVEDPDDDSANAIRGRRQLLAFIVEQRVRTRRLLQSLAGASTVGDGSILDGITDFSPFFVCPPRENLTTSLEVLDLAYSIPGPDTEVAIQIVDDLAGLIPLLKDMMSADSSDDAATLFEETCANAEVAPIDGAIYDLYFGSASTSAPHTICRPIDSSDETFAKMIFDITQGPSCADSNARSDCSLRLGAPCLTGFYDAFNLTAPRAALQRISNLTSSLHEQCSTAPTEADCGAVQAPSVLDAISELRLEVDEATEAVDPWGVYERIASGQ